MFKRKNDPFYMGNFPFPGVFLPQMLLDEEKLLKLQSRITPDCSKGDWIQIAIF
jgi:hypothetical protein